MFTEILKRQLETAKADREVEMMIEACTKLDIMLKEAKDLEYRKVRALECIASSLQHEQPREEAYAPKHTVSPYTGRHLNKDGTVQ